MDGGKIKAVTYVRVSSAAQVAKGHGAESQAARCEEFAKMKGYTVVKTFADKAVSGSLVERPAMKELLAFLRKHRKENIRVLIDDISRLARGLEAHLALRAEIAKAGGVLESPSIEFGSDSDSQLIEHLLASVSQHQRVKNAEQTRNRMEARMRSGYWPFWACIGLKFERREGHGKVLVRDEPLASIIQEGIEGFASGRFQTQAEVKRFFESQTYFPKNKRGLVRNQLVNDILTRVLYAGMVEHADWGVSRREGKHEGLISYQTFEKVQARLAGKAYAPARADINEQFPVRGAVECADCGHALTACFSKSKTGAHHPYYLCHHRSCVSYRKSIKRDDLESAVEAMLEGLTPNQTMFGMIREMFADAWNQQQAHAQALAKGLRGDMLRLEKQIEGLVDRIVDATSERVIQAYEQRIEGLERQKLVLGEKLQNAGKPRRPFEEMFELTIRFLSSPCNIWKNGSLTEKQTVLRLVLSDRLQYSRENGLRTPKTSNVFNIMKGENMRDEKLADWGGFEPPTPWFVAKYSIQLSYQSAPRRAVYTLLNQGMQVLILSFSISFDVFLF